VVIGLRQRQMQVALVGRVDVVAHVREAVRCGDAPRAGRASIRPRSYLASVRGAAMLTATGQDGRPAGSTGPI